MRGKKEEGEKEKGKKGALEASRNPPPRAISPQGTLGPLGLQGPTGPQATQGPIEPIAAKAARAPLENKKKPSQAILKLKKGKDPLTLNSLRVRNRLNTLIQGIIASRVQLSARGNIVVTLTTNITPREFLDSRGKWLEAFEGYEITGVESPEPYTRLVAHRVFRDLQDPSFNPIRAFKEEVRVFNPYRVKEELRKSNPTPPRGAAW